jgi:hypothetical protein
MWCAKWLTGLNGTKSTEVELDASIGGFEPLCGFPTGLSECYVADSQGGEALVDERR